MADGIRHHVVAAGRDIMVVSAVVSLLLGGVTFLTRPYWQPFADLPKSVAALQQETAKINATLSDGLRPRIVEFQGPGIIITKGPVRPGGSLVVLYSVKRNASCDTDVTPIFYNVDRGIAYQGDRFSALKTPVTSKHQAFSATIRIPMWLEPGRYSYYPEMSPVGCGVYGPIQVPFSGIFTIALTDAAQEP